MRGNLWRGFLIGLVAGLLASAGMAALTACHGKLGFSYGYFTWLKFLYLLPGRLLFGAVIGSIGGFAIVAVRWSERKVGEQRIVDGEE